MRFFPSSREERGAMLMDLRLLDGETSCYELPVIPSVARDLGHGP